MEATIEQILAILGEEVVKNRLLLEEIGKLRKEKAKGKGKLEANGNVATDSRDALHTSR